MKLSTVWLAPMVMDVVCSTARADLVRPTIPVGFVSIQSTGDITIGNSWTVPVTLFNVGNDLLVVEAVGADFEPDGISVTGPADWTGTWQSAGVGYVAGPVVTIRSGPRMAWMPLSGSANVLTGIGREPRDRRARRRTWLAQRTVRWSAPRCRGGCRCESSQ